MAKSDKISASVLSYEKKVVPSDGYMYGTIWKDRYVTATPLRLQEKSVKGTISNRFKSSTDKDLLKLDAKVQNANLQKVDSCALNIGQDTLKLVFTLKFLDNLQTPSTCNNLLFKRSYKSAVEDYIQEVGMHELAKRYALNIANARFLWRNRIGAEEIEVFVKLVENEKEEEKEEEKKEEKKWTFNAYNYALRRFDYDDDSSVLSLAKEIEEVLSGLGDRSYLLLEITTFVRTGRAQEIFPSEELVLDKRAKGSKSKILYHVNDIAAMHSQKIGNALRTIDNWYPNYETLNLGPIAVEPYGAVTNLGEAFRNAKTKSDFFTLFDKFAIGEKLENINDLHYVIATLIRGGVFGESSKE
jgi:CRISPR-associated protein Csy3